MSWYEPKPRQFPKRLPRRRPIKVVPSGIGDKGIVGNWLMYYLKGGDHLHDFSPNDNHGTINGASWKDGRYGWGLLFDGVNDYVETPTIDTRGKMSVGGWVKFDTLPAGGYPVIVENGGLFVLRYDVDGAVWEFYYKEGDIWAGNVVRVSHSISTGVWYYIVGTYDKSTGIAKIYANGGEKSNTRDIGSASVSAPTVSGYIGSRGGTGAYLNGIIPIVRIYTVVKSSSWISRRFERTKGIFGL